MRKIHHTDTSSDTTGCLEDGLAHLHAAILCKENIVAGEEVDRGCTRPEDFAELGRLMRAALYAIDAAMGEAVKADRCLDAQARARAKVLGQRPTLVVPIRTVSPVEEV